MRYSESSFFMGYMVKREQYVLCSKEYVSFACRNEVFFVE